MTHSVRLLTREDAAGVHALHARCFPPDGAWSAWSFRDTLALPTTIGLATEAGERLSGMILAQNTPPDADILTMCVDPDYRRAGLATDLLNGLVRLLGPYGVNRLCLDVAADNGAATAADSSPMAGAGTIMNAATGHRWTPCSCRAQLLDRLMNRRHEGRYGSA